MASACWLQEGDESRSAKKAYLGCYKGPDNHVLPKPTNLYIASILNRTKLALDT